MKIRTIFSAIFLVFLALSIYASDFTIDTTADFDAGTKTNVITRTERYITADQLELDFPYADKDTDLEMYLRMESEPAGVTPDETANNNDGSVVGATLVDPAKFDKGFNFDGTNDYISIPDNDSLDITGTITMSVWICPEDKESKVVMSKHSTTLAERGHEISFYPSTTLKGVIRNSAGTVYKTSTIITMDAWYHVAVVYDGEDVILYLDGSVADSTNAGAITLNTNDHALEIGKYTNYANDGTYNYKGKIDEPKIYSRALSAPEITALYNSGVQYKTAGSWESIAQTIPAGETMVRTTIYHSGLDAVNHIDKIEWLVGGQVKAAYETDITGGAFTAIKPDMVTSGSFANVDDNFQIKVYLVGDGSSTPVVTKVEGEIAPPGAIFTFL
ncbi:LamG domain-containing protein [Verrucomicrobiota bacterium]